MIDKQLVQKRFSERASTYDQFASVQKTMADELMHRIAVPPKTILEIGCGTGHLTEKLRRAFPAAHLTAVDIAEGMIAVAKARLGDDIVWRCADIETMELTERYDLIISNATFQWFNEAERTMARLFSSLHAGGQLLFSTFGARTFYELHTSFQAALNAHHLTDNVRIGPSFPTLGEWLACCERATNAPVFGSETFIVERFPSVRDFFLSLRHIGATNSTTGRYCQRPSVFKTLVREYEQRFSEDGTIRATYHCLFFDITR